MDYLELIARVTAYIPDKGQVMVRYYELYANAHKGKIRKAGLSPYALPMVEEDLMRIYLTRARSTRSMTWTTRMSSL